MNKATAAKGGVAIAGAGLMAFLLLWEGNEYEVYNDIVGIPTVCMGITGKDVVSGKTYSPEECEKLNREAVLTHGEEFLKCVNVPLAQHQYDAFASWTFNVGARAACRSTLVKKLNAGDYQGACFELLKWNKAGGREIQGLTNRRKAEYKMCMGVVE